MLCFITDLTVFYLFQPLNNVLKKYSLNMVIIMIPLLGYIIKAKSWL